MSLRNRHLPLALGTLLALSALPALSGSFARAEEGAAATEAPAEHGAGLSLRKVLFADVGEGASDEEKADAKKETLQFWGAVVNFSLLVILLVRFGKQPLSKFLTERRSEIERSIAEAADMKKQAEAVFQEYSERMKTLDQELAKLRADITRAAEEDKARIVADAEDSAKRLRAETEALIARQVEQLEMQIRREVVDAAIAAAERAITQATTDSDQQRLAETFARELAKPGMEKRS